ncbi:MAG: PcfJ domain-containing protein [bacterium]|nr:PcfJ domain-containing protein [bacterium]
MQKKELRKLRTLNATPAIIREAKNNEFIEEIQYYYQKKPHKVKKQNYRAFLRVQILNGYAKIAVFFSGDIVKGILSPRYEVFLNKKGLEYITRELKNGVEVGWRTAMLDNLIWNEENNPYSPMKSYTYLNPEGKKSLQRYLETRNTGYTAVCEWQKKIRKERITEKEKKEQEPWDQDMKLVPDIPKTFIEFMKREALLEHFVIYDASVTPKKRTGYCTRCQKTVPVTGIHNQEAWCPNCKHAITYKASGKIKTLSTENYYAGKILQNVPGGMVYRRYTIWANFYEAGKEPNYHIRETNRTLIIGGTFKAYEHALYKNKFYRWIPKQKNSFNESLWSKMYTRNLYQVEKSMKHTGLFEWIRHTNSKTFNIEEYLYYESRNPAIESLAKIGMYRLINGFMKKDDAPVDKRQTELAKILMIDGDRLKRLKAIDGEIIALRWYQLEKFTNRVYPDEMIKYFDDAKIINSDFGFLDPPMSYVKIYHYMLKQEKLTGETSKQVMITWRDYHNMASQMQFDTTSDQIARPKNVKEAHTAMIDLREKNGMKKQAKQLEKKWPRVNEIVKTLDMYCWGNDEFSVIRPNEIYDIVREGTLLRHCIHSVDFYFDRIQKRETYILFLRRTQEIDTPWYSLEVEPSGNIRQKRTTGDNQNEDFKSAVEFLKKWQKVVSKRLTAEEKKLGKKSEELRKQNYEKLRKDGNKVWHGKLAGQLLADVLEADFMAVG